MVYGHELSPERQPRRLALEVMEKDAIGIPNFETGEVALISTLTRLGTAGLTLTDQNLPLEVSSERAANQQFEAFLEEHAELDELNARSNDLVPFYLGQALPERATLEPAMWATPTSTLDGRTGEWKYDGDKDD
jgi:hypothetical protein